MEDAKNLETGFRVNNILLVESSFFRINNVIFDEKVENNINLDVDINVSGTIITVAETVSLDQIFQEMEQVKIRVKMVGVFEVVGSTEINDLNQFGKVNGAAIIFPYIREHIASCTLKAGLGGIILPPVNFAKE